MALRIDKLRFRNILVKGEVPEAPAIDFANALDDTFREQMDGVATKQDVDAAVQKVIADAAEREARSARQLQVVVSIILGGLLALVGLAVAILLAVLT